MIFVGCSYEDLKYKVFRSKTTPTEKSHGYSYKYIIGPFKTMRGAKFMAKYGKNNPHLQCVDDAERMAKYERKD